MSLMLSLSKSQLNRMEANGVFSTGNVLRGGSQKPARHWLFLPTVLVTDMVSPPFGHPDVDTLPRFLTHQPSFPE